jgi:hypothetical protein
MQVQLLVNLHSGKVYSRNFIIGSAVWIPMGQIPFDDGGTAGKNSARWTKVYLLSLYVSLPPNPSFARRAASQG